MNRNLLVCFSLFFNVFFLYGQDVAIPDISVVDLKGNKVNIKEISKDDKPTVLAFWATWCGPCIQELNAINDKIDDWRAETNLNFYAISLDDSKTVGRVKPMVDGKGWDFDILLDTNNDLKRQLNIPLPPYVVLIKNEKIVYQHVGYQPGSEDELFLKIKEYSN